MIRSSIDPDAMRILSSVNFPSGYVAGCASCFSAAISASVDSSPSKWTSWTIVADAEASRRDWILTRLQAALVKTL